MTKKKKAPEKKAPEKENYQETAQQAVANQVQPDANDVPEGVTVMDGEQGIDWSQTTNGSPILPNGEPAAEENFEVSAGRFVGVGVELMAGTWRSAFGENAALSDDEKTSYNSLFKRACDYYGLDAQVTGTKGFILELVALLFGTLVPRFANEESRNNFLNFIKNKGLINDERLESADNRGTEPGSIDTATTQQQPNPA